MSKLDKQSRQLPRIDLFISALVVLGLFGVFSGSLFGDSDTVAISAGDSANESEIGNAQAPDLLPFSIAEGEAVSAESSTTPGAPASNILAELTSNPIAALSGNAGAVAASPSGTESQTSSNVDSVVIVATTTSTNGVTDNSSGADSSATLSAGTSVPDSSSPQTTTGSSQTTSTTAPPAVVPEVTLPPVAGNAVPIPVNGAYFGMNSGDFTNGITVASREALLGQQFTLERIFYGNQHWTLDRINIDNVIKAHNEGRVPAVSYKVGDWKSVTAGQSDAIIDKLANQIKDSQIPILLTFHHEPDEEACLNSEPDCGLGQVSQDYVNMWRHIHGRFEAIGVNNVSWNFIVMGWQWGPHGNAERRQIIEDMFPGNQYVDWISSDLYNVAGNCSLTASQVSNRWSQLQTQGQGWYEWASQFNKPLGIMELGTFHDANQPGRKAQWFRNAIDPIQDWDIKAVAYFDRDHEGCDWRIDTGGDTELNGYRDLIRNPYFL